MSFAFPSERHKSLNWDTRLSLVAIASGDISTFIRFLRQAFDVGYILLAVPQGF